MGNRVRPFLVGLVMILVCLTGLLVASSLVPEVGCQKPPADFLQTKTRVRLSVPATALAGQPFTINGTLERAKYPGAVFSPTGANESFTEPFPQQSIVIFAQMQNMTVTTDEEGKFTAEITLKIPGITRIDAVYSGDTAKYFDDSGASKKIQIIGELPRSRHIDYRWLLYLMIGAVGVWAGYYVFQRLRHSRRIKERATTAPKTRRRKALSLPINWLLAGLAVLVVAAILFAIYPREGYSVDKGTVDSSRLITKIRLNAPSKVKPNESFVVKGTLTKVEKGSESVLAQQKITVWVEKISSQGLTEKLVTLVTDDEGKFDTKATLEYPGQYEISAVFDDTGELYIESSDARVVTVGSGPGPWGDWTSPGWFTLVIVLPLSILILAAGYLYYRHRRKKHPEEKTMVAVKVAAPTQQSTITTTTKPAGTGLRIEFPQITGQFPDVWGRGDNLLVVINKDSGNGDRPPELELEMEPGMPEGATLGKDGRASRDHIYRTTGEYEIKAEFAGKVRNGFVPAYRSLRIVDYREEIVRLYNEMIKMLQDQGISLSSKMTAREVERRLTRSIPALTLDVMDSLVEVFEEANYSLHVINRSAYERMYLAILEVEKHVRR